MPARAAAGNLAQPAGRGARFSPSVVADLLLEIAKLREQRLGEQIAQLAAQRLDERFVVGDQLHDGRLALACRQLTLERMLDRVLAAIDGLVAKGIADGEMPGAVVCIGRSEGIAFLKAYGDRQVEPSREPMTTDTVFDMASITKPVATATEAKAPTPGAS